LVFINLDEIARVIHSILSFCPLFFKNGILFLIKLFAIFAWSDCHCDINLRTPVALPWDCEPAQGKVFALEWVSQVLEFFVETRGNRGFAKKEGNKTLKWNCRTGVLSIAIQVALMFSAILKPMCRQIVDRIVKFIAIIDSCPNSAESILCLAAMFRIMKVTVDEFLNCPSCAAALVCLNRFSKKFLVFSNYHQLYLLTLPIVGMGCFAPR
jgi:hypothetical protein